MLCRRDWRHQVPPTQNPYLSTLLLSQFHCWRSSCYPGNTWSHTYNNSLSFVKCELVKLLPKGWLVQLIKDNDRPPPTSENGKGLLQEAKHSQRMWIWNALFLDGKQTTASASNYHHISCLPLEKHVSVCMYMQYPVSSSRTLRGRSHLVVSA